jgi:hypothetical protein
MPEAAKKAESHLIQCLIDSCDWNAGSEKMAIPHIEDDQSYFTAIIVSADMQATTLASLLNMMA